MGGFLLISFLQEVTPVQFLGLLLRAVTLQDRRSSKYSPEHAWRNVCVNMALAHGERDPGASKGCPGQGSDTRPCSSPSEGHGTLSSLNHSTRGSWHQLRAPSPVSLWHSPKMSLGGQTGDWRRHSHISGPPKILIRGP